MPVDHQRSWFCCCEFSSVSILALQRYNMHHDVRIQGIQCYKYNNGTHLYWINALKWTDQFSVLCIVGVSLYILVVCLSKRLEITCVQLGAARVFWLCPVHLLSLDFHVG